MTRDEFIQRYRIMSRTGLLYDRDMLLSACSRDAVARALKVRRPELAAVVDDDAFMRPMSGMVPARYVEAVALEAVVRRDVRRSCVATLIGGGE